MNNLIIADNSDTHIGDTSIDDTSIGDTSISSPSINPSEVEKFTAIAQEWWDEGGKFKPLHELNPVRLQYIKDNIERVFGDIKGVSILDIGCGGGLLSVPLARLGAKVTAIDAGEENIKVASSYAKKQNLEINFRNISAEELAQENKEFDVVLNMEVIEHVEDVTSFMESSAKLLSNNGLMFVATLNRTIKSYAAAIVGAEYILRWLPRGTHDWNKFLKPSEINQYLENSGVSLQEIMGVKYNPFNPRDKWVLSDDISINYMMLLQRC